VTEGDVSLWAKQAGVSKEAMTSLAPLAWH